VDAIAAPNVDRFNDTSPQDNVGGQTEPSDARTDQRHGRSAQLNHTSVIRPHLFNDVRFSSFNGDPVGHWGPLACRRPIREAGRWRPN
jgi:hypothetical protein